jgi:hypothetical protein
LERFQTKFFTKYYLKMLGCKTKGEPYLKNYLLISKIHKRGNKYRLLYHEPFHQATYYGSPKRIP